LITRFVQLNQAFIFVSNSVLKTFWAPGRPAGLFTPVWLVMLFFPPRFYPSLFLQLEQPCWWVRFLGLRFLCFTPFFGWVWGPFFFCVSGLLGAVRPFSSGQTPNIFGLTFGPFAFTPNNLLFFFTRIFGRQPFPKINGFEDPLRSCLQFSQGVSTPGDCFGGQPNIRAFFSHTNTPTKPRWDKVFSKNFCVKQTFMFCAGPFQIVLLLRLGILSFPLLLLVGVSSRLKGNEPLSQGHRFQIRPGVYLQEACSAAFFFGFTRGVERAPSVPLYTSLGPLPQKTFFSARERVFTTKTVLDLTRGIRFGFC